MALGWEDLQRMKRVEARANELGFILDNGQYTYSMDPSSTDGTLIYLRPKGDAFPHYSRNADIYCGTIESIDTWLTGFMWARDYDDMLKLTSDKKRKDKEKAERNRHLMRTLKTGRLVQGVVGTTDVNELRAYQDDEYEDIPF